jgi:hypothetical protein
MMVMAPPVDLEIRGRLADYLGGKATRQDFQQWLMPQAWNVEKRVDSATANLVRELELLLAEADHGDWTEAELLEKLSPFVTAYTFRIGEPIVTTSSLTEIQQVGFPQYSAAGTRRVMEFA